MSRMTKRGRVITASIVGILSCAFPIVGVFLVWCIFPKSLYSDLTITYALLVNGLNFAVIFAFTYLLISLATRPKGAALSRPL